MIETRVAPERTKGEVAEDLAKAHFDIDRGLERVIELEGGLEREADLIKLLEVNRDALPSGVQPLYFGAHPASGMFYPSVIVEVAPEEYEDSLAELEQRYGWKPVREIVRQHNEDKRAEAGEPEADAE